MGGYLCLCTWACTWLLVQTDSSCARESTPGQPLSRALRTRAAGGVRREGSLEPPVQRDLLQAAAGEGRLRRGHHGLVLSEQSWLSRAGWQRQDNMPWGAKLLGSPLKCFMRSDTYHLQSPACPRSRTTTALLLISLRSLCWLLNNKHRRGCCD